MASSRIMELPCSSGSELWKCAHAPKPAQVAQNHRASRQVGGFLTQHPHSTPSRTLHPSLAIATTPSATAEDRWIAQTLDAAMATPSPSTLPPPAPLSSLQSSCQSALATQRMPTTKNEEYKYTDLSFILENTMIGPSPTTPTDVDAAAAGHPLKQSSAATVVVVDGIVHSITLGNDNELPKNAFVGRLVDAPSDVVAATLGTQSRSRGGPFATLNGALARDAVVVYVPAHATITKPVHILYLSSSNPTATSGAKVMTVSAPRALIVLEEGAAAEVIEEYSSMKNGSGSGGENKYLVAAVTEIELDDRAALKHSYVELEAPNAAHFKSTLVNQGQESVYGLTEARLGGALTRHDLGIDQLGASTDSAMRSFLLAGESQLHDLHSKIKLDHPEGKAEQLHKCIAVHPSSRGVFDGNVKVNRLAQRTDAKQLSRNILLAPRATVNVKPNLQIIADDVKCTHGCSVSDLEEEELFYLRSRGISENVARQVLVYSFGREVVQHLRDEGVVGRVEAATKQALATFTTAVAAIL